MDYTYSWDLDGNTIPGETSTTLDLSAFAMADAGTYTCMVTNEAGTGMDSVAVEVGGECMQCITHELFPPFFTQLLQTQVLK